MADTKQSVRSTGILLIEDNYADQEIFKVFLAETEYANARLEIAEKISALDKFEIDFLPTVIILDLSLPDSDGLETLRLVQQKYGATPVIILTGFNDKNMGIQAVALGAEDYLIKGEFSSSSIERSISYAIERFKMRKTLIMTNKKLKSYNEKLQQFAFVVSHDLNAPISSLKGILSLLKYSESDEEKDRLLDLADESLELLTHKLNSLITILVKEKNQEGAETLNLKLKIEKAIRNTIVPQSLDYIDIHIDKSCDTEISFSKDLMNSVVQNLTSNAFKYRDLKKKLKLEYSVRTNYNYTILTIKDNGLGMDLKSQEDKIFKMFKRFHNHVSGNGIGLFLVKSIMETNDGYVEVESTPGIGTTFHLHFPKF
ncbi:sensor histidine kinase [Chondrinema litorale]|uniref:sensor histidine kinase n=1 Tax=Chondrinema litorale TaxID=2994555 RepID=UPI002542CF8E|nr:hybrid sensor histidine kinase/response regulator [Chondrinema litorale]UZR98156.1 hybrid sensor histidine kinase/response regulator [Chondrinema litorale]